MSFCLLVLLWWRFLSRASLSAQLPSRCPSVMHFSEREEKDFHHPKSSLNLISLTNRPCGANPFMNGLESSALRTTKKRGNTPPDLFRTKSFCPTLLEQQAPLALKLLDRLNLTLRSILLPVASKFGKMTNKSGRQSKYKPLPKVHRLFLWMNRLDSIDSKDSRRFIRTAPLADRPSFFFLMIGSNSFGAFFH